MFFDFLFLKIFWFFDFFFFFVEKSVSYQKKDGRCMTTTQEISRDAAQVCSYPVLHQITLDIENNRCLTHNCQQVNKKMLSQVFTVQSNDSFHPTLQKLLLYLPFYQSKCSVFIQIHIACSRMTLLFMLQCKMDRWHFCTPYHGSIMGAKSLTWTFA